ncbi:MAG: hypothetical protein WC499_02450 [Patescibacteria group bacterium]
MEMLSERYGWTPEEIRSQRKEDIDNYLNIIRAKEKIIRKKQNG